MAPKLQKSITEKNSDKTDPYSDFEESMVPSTCTVSVSIHLNGQFGVDGTFLAVFNGQIVLDASWQDGLYLETEALPLNLAEQTSVDLLADVPLMFLFRVIGKGGKEPDPLLNLDNRAGGNVDLFPLLWSNNDVFTNVPMVTVATGEQTPCSVTVRAKRIGEFETNLVPLTITLLSAHCLPNAKDGTAYIGAIGLSDIKYPEVVNFGMSQSLPSATQIVWASTSTGGLIANTLIDIQNDDRFIPEDCQPQNEINCNYVYWNAMKRVLVDPVLLQKRLSRPFYIELAGVPRVGKVDVRGRYMSLIDARVLLEPGQLGVTTCTKLLHFSELNLPDEARPLLDIPPTSAKASARTSDFATDDYGHDSYVVMRFDLTDNLVPKVKLMALFDRLGFPQPSGCPVPIDELYVDPPPEDPSINVRKIRKEAGALAVHKELSGFACRGSVPMTQSIKRTAANRLLLRVRSMLKQFPPDNISSIEWQDLVSRQHAACRRAVSSSFQPQPPPKRPPPLAAAARSRMAGANKIADEHVDASIEILPGHPRPLLIKALRCIEERSETIAKNYIFQALSAQTTNKFLLWILGGLEFDNKYAESFEQVFAAFRIAVKGDYSDGTMNAIDWAALHTLYHYHNQQHAAFAAAKRMRKSYSLAKEWKKFLQRWLDTSGEEEIYWIPGVISQDNPLMIAAAFFLCIRCYKFSEALLQCAERGCFSRGSHEKNTENLGQDPFYLRAASHIVRRQIYQALEITQAGINRFGPSAMMSQMLTTCLASFRDWNSDAEKAFLIAEKAGAELPPSLLLQAAVGILKTNTQEALQRAARAHKMVPSGHSALVIARIFVMLSEESMAERWAVVSVKSEPKLSDGWALLALLAMQKKDIDKARVMLRTAKQAGPISEEIEIALNDLMRLVKLDALPDSLTKNLCLCDYC